MKTNYEHVCKYINGIWAYIKEPYDGWITSIGTSFLPGTRDKYCIKVHVKQHHTETEIKFSHIDDVQIIYKEASAAEKLIVEEELALERSRQCN